jgi:hypothetical protein
MKPFLQTIYHQFLLPAIVGIVSIMIQCTQPVAGGTSTTDNPKIVGTILGDDYRPASNTRVILLPEGFDPQRDTLEEIVDTTDDRGRFVLPFDHEGVFNIQAVHLTKQTQLIILRIVVNQGDDSVKINDDTLKAPGTVTIELPDSVDHTNGYVYIPGTTIFTLLDNSSKATLHAVPATTLPEVRYAIKNSNDSRVLRYDIRVFPGAVSEVAMPGWKYSVKIGLNTTATGADIEGTVTNFPLCVRLNAVNFNFKQARSDGSDVRFTKKDGTSLLYETELWDETGKNAVLWVKMDTIYKNDSLQHIMMYWGASTPSPPSTSSGTSGTSGAVKISESNSAKVFDTTDGSAAVLHLGGSTLDASSAGNDGKVCSATDTLGIIGLCKKFNGSDSIMIPGLLGNPSSMTLCAWVKQDSVIPRGGGEIVSIGDAAIIRMDYENNGFGTGGAIHRSDTAVFNHLGSGRFLKKTGWHYVAFSFNGISFMSNLYIDGIPSGSRNDPGMPVNYSGVGQNTYIGKHANGKIEFGLIGCIDEVRIFRKVKSADYIKLCYMNQRIDDKLLVFEK